MRSDTDVVGLGHDCDLSRFGDTASVSDIWLSDVNTSFLEVWSEVFSGEQSFAESNGDGSLVVEVFHLLWVAREKGLLDKERSVWLKQLGELLRHRLVYSSVEVAES